MSVGHGGGAGSASGFQPITLWICMQYSAGGAALHERSTGIALKK